MQWYYSSADCINTNYLHNHMRKAELERKISSLENQIDLCDDMQMRSRLARKIARLRRELKGLSTFSSDGRAVDS